MLRRHRQAGARFRRRVAWPPGRGVILTPTVSVVIPTYNRAAYLADALDSVFSQEAPEIEVIVVDDGSTDGTPEVLGAYAGRIQTIRRESCSHCPSRVVNAGIRASQGEYVAFLDSDDMWLPGKIARQLALFASRPGLGFAYGNFVFMMPDGSISPPAVPLRYLLSGSILPALVSDMFVHPSTLIVRRTVLERAGLLDEDICRSVHYPLLLRLARLAEAASTREPITCVRRHAGQYSVEEGPANFESAILALERLLADPGLGWPIRLTARRTLARFHTHLARTALSGGALRRARRQVWAAQRSYPFSRATWISTAHVLARSFGVN